MRKVITYGTYDLLHYGHIRLLERAKALGDYLIVGVTADSFDKVRGKINVSQSLTQRIENVRKTGLADEIIVEEYEGQKIDDIKRLDVDVFTVGSDWRGYFDYLSEFCEVVYLDRTQGVSSTELRSDRAALRLGFIGCAKEMVKQSAEVGYINGMTVSGVFDPYGGASPVYNCVSPHALDGPKRKNRPRCFRSVNVHESCRPTKRWGRVDGEVVERRCLVADGFASHPSAIGA